ncbi:alpha/beta fold hydrolase [Ammoniphilus sp. YIM 78166]|uniref:alpha/beta fold hydrolase n=1 Tax=Ammoniphilus sp. YIM 78166 TaxID=1644106 RepID=UPI00142FCA68|nr:alpha/beta hydrolase [Ammoniphilus sp. YIM 78166]
MKKDEIMKPKYLFYEVRGNGPPILFLHGLGMKKQVWEPIIEQLKDRFLCISIDLLGFGENRASEECERILFDQWIDQVQELLQKISLTKIHLVGHSLGSFIALAFASKYPSACSSVTAISTLPEFNQAMTDAFEQRALQVEIFGLNGIIDDLIKVGFSKETLENRPDIVKKYKEIICSNTAAQYALCCRSVANLNNYSLLNRITTPVQLIVGLDDKITPPALSEIVREWIPRCKMYALEGSGHQVHMEKPEEIAKIVSDFL